MTELIVKQSEIQSQNEPTVSYKFFTKYTLNEFKKNIPIHQQGLSFHIRKDIIGSYISRFLKQNPYQPILLVV